ncbi:MAG TPA: glycoside hydrolase family 3 N-terminal domain-containing protein [Bacillales bacterium]|nr:glycoside hydrolase family 3 N-terminal domain-containing protein [Bacillales bacterium]
MLKRLVFTVFAALLTFTMGRWTTFAQTTGSSNRYQSDRQIQKKVNALIAKMTLQEKISMVHGVYKPGYIGYIPGIPSLGIPPLKLTDGPAGVRQGGTTAFPAPIGLAASWDTGLAYKYGAAVGQETLAKGQNQILGPTINILRVPQWGRSFESYSEDPYLNFSNGCILD